MRAHLKSFSVKAVDCVTLPCSCWSAGVLKVLGKLAQTAIRRRAQGLEPHRIITEAKRLVSALH